MAENKTAADVVIVGGGVSGLAAGRMFKAHDYQPTILEAEGRVGGRLATLRLGPAVADTGAQYFTVRSTRFHAWVEQWLTEKLAYRWSTGWSQGSLNPVNLDSYPRYAVHGGMAALAAYLARGLDIRLRTRLVSLTPTGGGWLCQTDTGTEISARAVILTPPVPQSLEILAHSHLSLPDDDRAALEKISYAPCLVGVFRLSGPIHLPEPGAIQHSYAPVTWIVDNQQKGISPDAPVVTVQASEPFSREYWDAANAQILRKLGLSFKAYMGRSSQILQARLVRWPYARPTQFFPQTCFQSAALPRLVFAGDAFGAARIEGAVLSGADAATMLIQEL